MGQNGRRRASGPGGDHICPGQGANYEGKLGNRWEIGDVYTNICYLPFTLDSPIGHVIALGRSHGRADGPAGADGGLAGASPVHRSR